MNVVTHTYRPARAAKCSFVMLLSFATKPKNANFSHYLCTSFFLLLFSAFNIVIELKLLDAMKYTVSVCRPQIGPKAIAIDLNAKSFPTLILYENRLHCTLFKRFWHRTYIISYTVNVLLKTLQHFTSSIELVLSRPIVIHSITYFIIIHGIYVWRAKMTVISFDKIILIARLDSQKLVTNRTGPNSR